MLNPLKLAYVGDAVYEVYVRQYLINSINNSPSEMSKKRLNTLKRLHKQNWLKAYKAISLKKSGHL